MSLAQLLGDLRSEGTEVIGDVDSGDLRITIYCGEPLDPPVILRMTPEEFERALKPTPGTDGREAYRLLLAHFSEYFDAGGRPLEMALDGPGLTVVRWAPDTGDRPPSHRGDDFRWLAYSPFRTEKPSRRGRRKPT